ncbi:MAG: pilus assembly protein TadB, partial [Hyphomonas sp.]
MFGWFDLAAFDQRLIIPAAMAIGALILAIQSSLNIAADVRTQRIVNRRLQFKDRYETHDEAMVELRKSRGLDRDGNLALSLRWLNQMIVRSGLTFQPARWALMSLAGASAAAIAAWIYLGGWVAAVPVFILVLIAAPILVIRHFAITRAKKLAAQLTDAL